MKTYERMAIIAKQLRETECLLDEDVINANQCVHVVFPNSVIEQQQIEALTYISIASCTKYQISATSDGRLFATYFC